jgi:hypothetical protein
MRSFLLVFVSLLPFGVAAQPLVQDGVRPRGASVQSSALQEVGPWGAAALPEGIAPLSSDLWQGADPATLGLLFERLSADQRFPSLQTLIRQAVFSGGAAPTNDPDIARGRLDAANRLGPAEASARLIFGVPRLSSRADLAAIAIDAGLRVGRVEEACSLVEAITAPPQGTLWQEARAACYALNDEPAAANLSVDLARTRGLTDTWLSRAIAATSGSVTAPPPFRADSGRALALSLKAKLKPPVTLANMTDPVALSALVGTPDFMATVAPEEKLSLVRNGAGRGVIAPSVLAAHQPIPDPAAILPPMPAQIAQKLLAAPTLALRAIEARAAYVDLKTVVATQPGMLTLADLPILIEAALWSGDGALATSIAALAPDTLDPRLAMILSLYDPTSQGLAVQRRLDGASADPVTRRLALRDLMVIWSAGVPADAGVSQLVQTGLPWGQAGNAGLRAALELAGQRGSKGEVALLTGVALQGVEPNAIEPETLVVAVRALRRAGLADAARDLARDYLLANFVTLPARMPTRPRAEAPAAPRPRLQPTQSSIQPTRPSSPPPITRPAARPAPRPATSPPPPPPASPARVKPSWGTP